MLNAENSISKPSSGGKQRPKEIIVKCVCHIYNDKVAHFVAGFIETFTYWDFLLTQFQRR